MNSTRQSRRITLQSLTVCGALCFTFFLNMNSAGANEWVGIDPIDPIEPIATEHALVEHPFRTPSKPKTWIVERTTWPNPGLLRKIDPGAVVRVLEQGIQHNGEWLRVETIDAERTRGLAMAHLLVPARDEDVRAAFQQEQRAIEQAIEASAAEQRRLQASARRVIEEAHRLESSRAQALQIRNQVTGQHGQVGMDLAVHAFKTAVESMKRPVPSSSVREVRVPGAPAALATPQPPPSTSVGAAPPAQVASALPHDSRPAPVARPEAGAAPPAQAASAPPSTPVPAAAPPAAAPAPAGQTTAGPGTAPQPPTFAEAGVGPTEPVLAIGQTDPRPGIAAARTIPAVSWGKISLFIMLLVGVAAGLIHLNETRKARAAELVTLTSVPLARDASLSLVKAQERTLVVGTTPHGVQLVTDLGQGDDLLTSAGAYLNDVLVPSVANSRPAPLSRLLREDTGAPLATRPESVRRLAAAKRKLFGGAV
ncbi:MAG: hypothetical protein CL940_06820 [Deltaproteobacteria bacterium]|nr:hypothetical protein [Deltaproteobacteria bacterium]